MGYSCLRWDGISEAEGQVELRSCWKMTCNLRSGFRNGIAVIRPMRKADSMLIYFDV